MKAIYKFSLLFILLVASPRVSFSQIYNSDEEQIIPETNNFYQGEVILNNKTVVKGLVSINHRQKQQLVTIVKSTDNISYIPNSEIELVTISKSNNNNRTENSFEKIDTSGKLYRIVGNGKRKIYDESSKPTTNLVGEVFIKDGLNIISLYNFWSSGPKQDLVNYINKRDNKDFTKRDFNTIDELISVALN